MKLKPFTSAVFLPIALLAGFVVLGFMALGHPRQVASPLPPSPVLHLQQLTPNMQQKIFDLSSMRGQKVLVNFFASWCVPCVAEIPLLRNVAMRHTLAIVGVAYNDNFDAVTAFLSKFSNPYARVLLDPMGHAAIDWGVRGVPESFLLDEQGHVIATYPGPLSEAVWLKSFAPFFPPPPQI